MASWGPNDQIIFATTSGLHEVPAAGGEARTLTTADPSVGESQHLAPHILPSGEAVLFENNSLGRDDIEMLRLDTLERRVLVVNGQRPQFVASGHIVFGRDDSIWAIPFDAETLEVIGDPVPLVDGVMDIEENGGTQFAASQDGSLAYLTGSSIPFDARALVWVDRTGREEAIPIEPRAYAYPRVSPDGSTIALSETFPYDIWSWNVSRQTRSRVTFDPGVDVYPTWLPDSETIVFTSNREGAQNLFRRRADGTGGVERITESPNQQRVHAISPDGKWVVKGGAKLDHRGGGKLDHPAVE
ncbi:MAG: hypothetical protein O3B84_07945, partial [Chloroflexi bacterium]|nr:hypothetical protein [Chloroflexota bacterium]